MRRLDNFLDFQRKLKTSVRHRIRFYDVNTHLGIFQLKLKNIIRRTKISQLFLSNLSRLYTKTLLEDILDHQVVKCPGYWEPNYFNHLTYRTNIHLRFKSKTLDIRLLGGRKNCLNAQELKSNLSNSFKFEKVR